MRLIKYWLETSSSSKIMLCAPTNSVIEDLHKKLEKIIPKEEILIYQAMKNRNGSYIGPKAIEAARVVKWTVTTSGNQILRKYTYEKVIIDEAGQCAEPETLLPILHESKNVILVGGHKQLEPFVADEMDKI